MRHCRLTFVTVCLSLCTTLAAQTSETHYPIGAVVVAAANGYSSREAQQFHLQWLKHAGFNAVETEALGMAEGFASWDVAEKSDGEYDWTIYDQYIEDAAKAGLDVYLQILNWRSPPAWFWEKYPDAYMMSPLGGKDQLVAIQRDDAKDLPAYPSLAHPQYKRVYDRFVRALVERYADHPSVRGYFIGEELGLNNIWPPANYYGLDFSPAIMDAFHAHLRQQYTHVDAMNQAWGAPQRYKNFEDVTWSSQWANDSTHYAGEWMAYYQFLQATFAEHFNRSARIIHEVDPEALVMVSGFEIFASVRMGHGTYLPLIDEVDAFAYKSYWHPNRQYIDWISGITGKQVWVSNLNERESTTGPVESQRYIEPIYVRREFWRSYASGLRGVFLFIWSPLMPDHLQKHNLLEAMSDGSTEPISAAKTAGQLARFLNDAWPTINSFQPSEPQIVVHDPNKTFIGQFWRYANPTAERMQTAPVSTASDRFDKSMRTVIAMSRRFTVSTSETLNDRLGDNRKLWILAGCDLLSDQVVDKAIAWVKSGRALIIDDQTARYDLLGREVNAFASLRGQSNVLVLQGERWEKDKAEVARLQSFIANSVPMPHRIKASNHESFYEKADIQIMHAPDGRELAVITRVGSGGTVNNTVDLKISWSTPHQTVHRISPFAVIDQSPKPLEHTAGTSATDVQLLGFEDAILLLAH